MNATSDEQNFEDLLKETEFLTKEFFAEPVDPFPIKDEEKETHMEVIYEENDGDNEKLDVDDATIPDQQINDNVTEEEGEEEKEKPDLTRVKALTAIEKKLVGIYFSAGWCPPCKQFTPLLKDFYEEIQRRNAPFEVVFVSFDKKEDDMIQYYRDLHGEWLAVGFDDPLKEALKSKYKIHAVPKLIIVNSSGEIITTKGRKEIQDKGIICFRNWQEICTFRENRAKSQASMHTTLESKEDDD